MAMIKLLEYTFDNTIDTDCLPTFTDVGTIEVIDSVSGNITTRIINVEETGLPTKISFTSKTALTELLYANTDNVNNMHDIFSRCTNLKYVNLECFNTSKVTSMTGMFYNCSSLTSLDVSNFNTSKVTNMRGMFRNCSSLTSLDVSNFNTSKVTDMYDMFYNCQSLTSLDLSNFDMANVTNTTNMFANCNQLTNIGLLYSDSATINTIASLLPTTIAKKIYYQDAISSDLMSVNNVDFVEYVSNTISSNEVILRSLPNGVCDTLDLETGEYVQRIGEIVFDGSEDWNVMTYQPNENGTHYQFQYWLGEHLIGGSLWENQDSIICDTLPSSNYTLHWQGIGEYGIGGDRSFFMITWRRDSCPFNDVATLKTWLSQNPITVQYELATPITKTIDLKQHPFAYKDGYVVLTSSSEEVSLTPTIEYSLIANRLGQIQSNQKLVEKQQAQIDELESMVITNLVNTQYQQALNEIKLGVK